MKTFNRGGADKKWNGPILIGLCTSCKLTSKHIILQSIF